MKSLRVLVIEDDKPTLDQLVRLLEKEGYEVTGVASGRDGLAQIESRVHDIVVTDLRLPELSGLDILEAIRSEGIQVPVILVTAYGETDTALRAIRLGALDYLKKPIEVDDLLTALGRAKEVVAELHHIEEFPSLLLVEDDTPSRQNLANVLRKENYVVVEAQDGEEAVRTFSERKFDIVLLDLKMPRKNGLTAFAEMRKISYDFEAIILTGWGDEAAAIQALRLGAFAFTKKPIDLGELLMNIEKAVNKRSADRALRFRTREVALANQIIAQLVSNEDIVVEVSNQVLKNAGKQATTVLNALSDGLLILNAQRQVVYANARLEARCPDPLVELDDQLGMLLGSSGASLNQELRAASEAPAGKVHKLETTSHRLTITTANVVRDGKPERFVVMLCVPLDRNYLVS